MALETNRAGISLWQEIQFSQKDVQLLTAHLFEHEEPLTLDDLTLVLIKQKIEDIKREEASNREEAGVIYQPYMSYALGTKVIFPELNWSKGVITAERPGDNPDLGTFNVIKVLFDDGSESEFATSLPSHPINEKTYNDPNAKKLDLQSILSSYGSQIKSKLQAALLKQKDLVRIGFTWFPKSLLIDINKGQLNLVEAVLDSKEGGPLSTPEIMHELEIETTQETSNLTEFSLNYALQEDPRFDEVGTTGVFSWFLRRMEPESVLEVPVFLRCQNPTEILDGLDEDTSKLLWKLNDELSYQADQFEEAPEMDTAMVTLTYPHWRSGSLPITPLNFSIFPTAFETDNVKITFVDAQSQENISAWVVRSNNYAIGLRDWYEDQNLIPGSNIEISLTDDPGVILIQPQKKRSNKEWIKTVLVGADGGLVFALLRQPIYAGFSDRMAIAIPDVQGIDQIWKDRANKTQNLNTDVRRMMAELSKLNSQHHVHFVDLYAAVNVIRRTPPQNLLHVLLSNPEYIHVGDHYYHLAETN